MTWFKVDDGFWSHPKILSLSPEAIALWVRAGSWSAAHLTDGHIPETALRLLGARKRPISRLISAQLWTESRRGGYQFHDWNKYQPTRAQVEQQREKTRKRVGRHRSGNEGCNGVTGDVTNGAPDPTRPDPTRPKPPLGGEAYARAREPQPPLRSDVRSLLIRAYAEVFESAVGDIAPSPAANDEAFRAVAAWVTGHCEHTGSPPAEVIGRILRHYAARESVVRNRMPVKWLAEDPGRYLDPPEPSQSEASARLEELTREYVRLENEASGCTDAEWAEIEPRMKSVSAEMKQLRATMGATR